MIKVSYQINGCWIGWPELRPRAFMSSGKHMHQYVVKSRGEKLMKKIPNANHQQQRN